MSYMEWEETYHLDCIHEGHLYNQGITFCNLGRPLDCDNCPFKQPEDQVVKCSSASTD